MPMTLARLNPGIDLLLDNQLKNINTCKPLSGTYVGGWNANSIGVYSDYHPIALSASFTYVASNHGIAQALTKHPSFYTEVAQHVHVITHIKDSVTPNSIHLEGEMMHTAHLSLSPVSLNKINTSYPYTKNPITLTPNSGGISRFPNSIIDRADTNIAAERVIQKQQVNTTSYAAFVATSSLRVRYLSCPTAFIDISMDTDTVPAAVAAGGATSSGCMHSGRGVGARRLVGVSIRRMKRVGALL